MQIVNVVNASTGSVLENYHAAGVQKKIERLKMDLTTSKQKQPPDGKSGSR
ncbi:hypothetical protein BH10CYA1_BH10CYA1_14340 [soil metagenome]